MRHDTLSDVMSAIKNADDTGKDNVITSASSLVKDVLLVLQKHNYIGDFEMIDDRRGSKFKIILLGKINSCGSIRPRFSFTKDQKTKWERRFLPASDVGMIIVTTSHGVMRLKEAIDKQLGGKLLSYVY